MNIKLKSILAVAVTGLVMSGSANAITKSADGEMFLVAFDANGNNSYIKALGVSASSFTGNGTYSASLSSDTNWTSFLSAANAAITSANTTTPGSAIPVYYSVLGYQFNNDSSLSTLKTTANPVVNTPTNATFDELNSNIANGSLGTWMTTLNSTVTGTASKYVPSATGDDSANVIGNAWGAILTNLSTANMGTSAVLDATNGFYSFTATANEDSRAWGGTPLTSASVDVNGSALSLGNWLLTSGGNISYVAAVPEADTSAMLLAGIGLMGFIARRRSTK